MIYEYERDGERIERSFPIGTAPQSVRVGRLKYRRVLSVPGAIQVGDTRHGRRIDYLAEQFDADKFGKFHKGDIRVDPQDGIRKLHFTSTEQERHFQRAANAAGHSIRKCGEVDELAKRVAEGRKRYGTPKR